MGKGSDGQKNGGDTTDLIIRGIGAIGGAMVGGPSGAKMGWDMGGMGADMITGKGDGSSSSIAGTINKIGDKASGVAGMAQGGGDLTSVLGNAKGSHVNSDGSGVYGGPSLDMNSLNGADAKYLSPEELLKQNKMNGMVGVGPTASSPTEGSDILGRLLSFQSSMGSAQPQQTAMPAAQLMQISPRQSSSSFGTYNSPSTNLIPSRPIADNRRY